MKHTGKWQCNQTDTRLLLKKRTDEEDKSISGLKSVESLDLEGDMEIPKETSCECPVKLCLFHQVQPTLVLGDVTTGTQNNKQQ